MKLRLLQRLPSRHRSNAGGPSGTPAGALIDSPELPRPDPSPLGRRELTTEALAGAAFLAAAAALALLLPSERAFDGGVAVLLVVAYAGCARVRFFAGAGYTTPAEVVFVAMLFMLPLGLVPLAVAVGLLLANLPHIVRREVPPDRLLVIPADAWYSIGPVLVLAAAGAPGAGLEHWPVFLAALLAQFVGDLVVSLIRERVAYGTPPRRQLNVMGWIWMVDAALAPLGMLAAMASAGHPYATLLALPLVPLIAVFARERNARIEQALELSATYRGTVMLLGDLLERSDSYTGGEHTAGVIELSSAVALELELDAHQCRRVELVATLHDIGKVFMPQSVINKPAPLDDAEWAIMRTHTIEGQRMLERVGGDLADIGLIVRSSHERYDGGGYPDGLAGPDIPLEAAVVAVCDAFDAMTTDRPYRRARTRPAALAELRAESGRQFVPEVVVAVERVITRRIESERRHHTRRASPAVDWAAGTVPPLPAPMRPTLPSR